VERDKVLHDVALKFAHEMCEQSAQEHCSGPVDGMEHLQRVYLGDKFSVKQVVQELQKWLNGSLGSLTEVMERRQQPSRGKRKRS